MSIVDAQQLKAIIHEENWDQLLELVKPKYFVKQEAREPPNTAILAQICQILITETSPNMVKILCLKCLGNSCLDSYKYRQYTLENRESDKYNKYLYDKLAENNVYEYEKDCDYPYSSHFPYDGIIKWTINYISAHDEYNATTVENEDVLAYLNHNNLKQAIMNSIQSDHKLLANAACIFVHNAVKQLQENYFTDDEKNHLCSQLLKPIKEGFTSAKDALLYILHYPNVFETTYNNMAVNEKLDLLEIIYDELWQSTHQTVSTLTNDAAEFLALTFCKKSDLILKTVDTYVDSIDPTEIILILNILGSLTLMPYKISKNARPLIINCKYLLMSLHMMGKESNNYFTPITNLSQVAPNIQRRTIHVNSTTNDASVTEQTTNHDPQDHPVYGFKSGLIKVIGNMVYRNKMYQDLFREIDGIPLLLDCCNIDARNPLILQWTILALRNLCEGNLENQEIIRNCKKEGVAENAVLQEIGLTLHEDADGQSVCIAPLRRD
ncbi:ataxin-10 isoform X2 [Odontomachus brunneus]|uniref:ataxin-10 isoform X2 n=1 Tax=Odontomachus brunneus TaxID=486640 RepID=UPI0013F2071C|nr:ataxin-10 isoform X2 [Odontomachus brunneus]